MKVSLNWPVLWLLRQDYLIAYSSLYITLLPYIIETLLYAALSVLALRLFANDRPCSARHCLILLVRIDPIPMKSFNKSFRVREVNVSTELTEYRWRIRTTLGSRSSASIGVRTVTCSLLSSKRDTFCLTSVKALSFHVGNLASFQSGRFRTSP